MNRTPLTPLDLNDALLARLPLFPLPDAVLFPGAVMPLHFFEERYRALARDCVNGDRVMVLGTLANVDEQDADADTGGPPAVHPIVTIGAIAAERKLADGRWDIALKGLCRAEIVAEHTTGDPYRSVQVRRLKDRERAEDRVRSADLRSAVIQLANLLPALWPQLSPLLNGATTASGLADVVASMFVDDRDLRRSLLEELRVGARFEILTDVIGEILLDLTFRTAGGDDGRRPLKH